MIVALVVLLVLLSLAVAWAFRKRRPVSPSADRWVRTQFDPAAFGLVPREQLDPRRPGPEPDGATCAEEQKVAEAAWGGDWRVAAAYAEEAGADWDERWSRIETLAQIARGDDRWLTDWRTALPDSGDAGTVHALVLVDEAWAIRGSAYAHQVPDEDMRRFRSMLPAAMAAAQRTADRAPHDPGPWVVMITAARAMSYSQSQFHDLWRNLTARAPHHTAAHWQALQYWCAKWHGSDELMLDFAVRAVTSAPHGSTLPGLYLHALDELDKVGKRAERIDGLRGAQGRARLEDIARRLDSVPQDHPELPQLRHLLAYRLGRVGAYGAALEQFRRLGPYCGARPWKDDEAGAVVAFDRARGLAARGASRRG
ncbi:hypothetical protein [Streptomyces bambusae]|uniref:DUF4034 domain-containing protein n=1 Tax=Streptomyces bambusae TaxID=1550616 RepID=A0ABS6Z2L7_9ACTN|nr:hypothetical protein [Streptomyces bambusae]MBW5481972.1 hypothetical protein [Streptomyces bambusae]